MNMIEFLEIIFISLGIIFIGTPILFLVIFPILGIPFTRSIPAWKLEHKELPPLTKEQLKEIDNMDWDEFIKKLKDNT